MNATHTMSHQILDGKATSRQIEQELAEAVQERQAQGLKAPHLAAVLVGDNPASRAYVGHKVKACERVGFESTLVECPADITEEALLEVVDDLNGNDGVDGYIVQLPSPTTSMPNGFLKPCFPPKTWMASTPSTPEKCRLTCLVFCLPTPWAS